MVLDCLITIAVMSFYFFFFQNRDFFLPDIRGVFFFVLFFLMFKAFFPITLKTLGRLPSTCKSPGYHPPPAVFSKARAHGRYSANR